MLTFAASAVFSWPECSQRCMILHVSGLLLGDWREHPPFTRGPNIKPCSLGASPSHYAELVTGLHQEVAEPPPPIANMSKSYHVHRIDLRITIGIVQAYRCYVFVEEVHRIPTLQGGGRILCQAVGKQKKRNTVRRVRWEFPILGTPKIDHDTPRSLLQ